MFFGTNSLRALQIAKRLLLDEVSLGSQATRVRTLRMGSHTTVQGTADLRIRLAKVEEPPLEAAELCVFDAAAAAAASRCQCVLMTGGENNDHQPQPQPQPKAAPRVARTRHAH